MVEYLRHSWRLRNQRGHPYRQGSTSSEASKAQLKIKQMKVKNGLFLTSFSILLLLVLQKVQMARKALGSISKMNEEMMEQDPIFKIATSDDTPLPVYWINLDQSTERRRHMEDMFANIRRDHGPILDDARVPAVDVDEVQEMIRTERFIPNGVKIVPPDDDPDWKKHFDAKYTLTEVACLISHLNAILNAYTAGYEMALVVEDDIALSTEFILHWKPYAKLAPSDWNVLQWTTINDAVFKHSANLHNDPWINWQPDHWGTQAYTINRRGMKQILDNSLVQMNNNTPHWRISEQELIVSDEVVYYLAKKAYTSTALFIYETNMASTIGSSHVGSTRKHDSLALQSKMSVLRHPEKILIVTNFRLKDKESIENGINALKLDIEALSNSQLNAHWSIRFVVVHAELQPILLSKISDLPDFVMFDIFVNKNTFNKWGHMAAIVNNDTLLQYDYVLHKDEDILLAGFPWNTFIEKKGNATIAGVLRQTIEESLAKNRRMPKRQYFQFHEGEKYKKHEIPEYISTTAIATDFLEQCFVLIQADFAHWYFKQVLHQEFLSQESDWAIDYMWCKAASEYFPEKEYACSLVPVVALHADNRQIIKKSNEIMSEPLRIFGKEKTFSRWLETGMRWKKFIKNRHIEEVLKHCVSQSLSKDRNLTECTRNFVESN